MQQQYFPKWPKWWYFRPAAAEQQSRYFQQSSPMNYDIVKNQATNLQLMHLFRLKNEPHLRALQQSSNSISQTLIELQSQWEKFSKYSSRWCPQSCITDMFRGTSVVVNVSSVRVLILSKSEQQALVDRRKKGSCRQKSLTSRQLL